MFSLASALWVGWALGANDAASAFGVAVATSAIRYRLAIGLTALFVLLGATLEGYGGFATYGAIVPQSSASAFLTSLAAALTITPFVPLGLPISTTQAVVGATAGLGLILSGPESMNWAILIRLGIAWALAPITAALVAFGIYWLLALLLARFSTSLPRYDRVLAVSLVLIGAYGAYSLGANNVANVTGAHVRSGLISPPAGAIVGAAAIALGAFTSGRRTMHTVGRKITYLDPFSGLVATLSQALVLHGYAIAGIPISASQAIVGAIFGTGLVKGLQTVNRRTLLRILLSWFGAPLVSAAIAIMLYELYTMLQTARIF